jgi:FKBP-type peptidyl-prolyl cis-trans isomerase FkpA
MQASLYRNIFGVLLLVFAITGCGQQPAEGSAEQQAESTEQAAAGGETQVAATKDEAVEITELQIIEVVEGGGAEAQAGQEVVVHYTGWLYEPDADGDKGEKFDSSVDRGDPFVFPLGGGRVIRGWDEGVAGMQVGGKRTLIIPADMAYGDRGAGAVISPGATLVFDVELLEIR